MVELSYWSPSRRLKRSRAPDLDVHLARADPAPFGKTASRDPSTRSPRRCWRSVKRRTGRDLAHGVGTRTHNNHSGPVATLVRRVGVRELRLHPTVTGRLRRCPAEPTRGRGGRVGRRVGTSLRCGYLVPVHTRAGVPRGRSGGALGGLGRARRILLTSDVNRGGKGLNIHVPYTLLTQRARSRRRGPGVGGPGRYRFLKYVT